MRALLAIAAALVLWDAAVRITGLPPYLLPGPVSVAQSLWVNRGEIWPAALLTAYETLLGLAIGAGLGIAVAAAMAAWPRLGRALSPVLVVSQTIPVFALAPILTLWLGFGLAPKVAIVVLIVFVPVAQLGPAPRAHRPRDVELRQRRRHQPVVQRLRHRHEHDQHHHRDLGRQSEPQP